MSLQKQINLKYSHDRRIAGMSHRYPISYNLFLFFPFLIERKLHLKLNTKKKKKISKSAGSETIGRWEVEIDIVNDATLTRCRGIGGVQVNER